MFPCFCLIDVPNPIQSKNQARLISEGISKYGLHPLVQGSYRQCVTWARALAGLYCFALYWIGLNSIGSDLVGLDLISLLCTGIYSLCCSSSSSRSQIQSTPIQSISIQITAYGAIATVSDSSSLGKFLMSCSPDPSEDRDRDRESKPVFSPISSSSSSSSSSSIPLPSRVPVGYNSVAAHAIASEFVALGRFLLCSAVSQSWADKMRSCLVNGTISLLFVLSCASRRFGLNCIRLDWMFAFGIGFAV